MCISAEASLKSFFSTIIFIGLLLKFRIKKNARNLIYIFSISSFYVILIAVYRFFIWVLDKKGFNKIESKLAPLLLFTQPLIMYLVGRKIFPEKKVPNSISVINILYFIYFIINVIRNWNKNSCTGILEETGHLLWKWKWQPLGYFYLILIIINFSFYTNHFYGITV